jgi:hypothetical protein
MIALSTLSSMKLTSIEASMIGYSTEPEILTVREPYTLLPYILYV